MKGELISIIVPVYNVQKYLNKCVESIVEQTYKNIEIILVDDGSTDGSAELCDEWNAKDSRIKVIHQDSFGVSRARNEGLKVARGEYIGFIDGDDYAKTNMFEILLDNLKKTLSDISMCGYIIVKNENEKIDKSTDELLILENNDMFFEDYNLYNGYTWNKLFKKSLLKNIRFDEKTSMCEDLLFVTCAAIESKKSCFYNKGLYYYNIRNGSAAFNFEENINLEKVNSIIYADECLVKIMKDNDIHHENVYEADVFNFSNLAIHELELQKDDKERLKKKEHEYYEKLIKKNISFEKKMLIFIRYRFYLVYRIIKNKKLKC